MRDRYFISEHPRTIVREIVHLRRTCLRLDASKAVVGIDDLPSADARICDTCLRGQEFNDAMGLWRHWGRPMAAALLLLLTSAVTAVAQPQPPGQPQITFGAPGLTTVPMTITWTPSPPPVSYLIEGSYGDGSGALSTSQAATTLIHPLPYHSSGAASGGYVCVRSVSGSLQSDGVCNGFQSLAKPTDPPPGPPTGLTKDIEYDEPTLSDCTGRPAPCSTVLSDLARTTVYYSVDGGPTVKALEVPATRPQGGGHIATQFQIAATTGTARVWITATDTGGNEGPASGSTTVILGAVTPPPPPQPAAPLVRNRCTVRVSSSPPDTTGGWSAQFRNGASAIGTVDSAAPYERDVILPPGPYSITVRWTKTGVPAQTSVAWQGTCQ